MVLMPRRNGIIVGTYRLVKKKLQQFAYRGAAARYGGGAAAGRWQGRCQGVGVGASVLRWHSGIGGGGALAAAPVPPPTLMLCLVCFARLELLGLLCSARIRVVGSRCALAATGEYKGGGAAVLGSICSARFAQLDSLGLLRLAGVGVGPLTRWLALRACGPGRR